MFYESRFADGIVNALLFYMDRENAISWSSVELQKKKEVTAEDEGMHVS